MELGSRVLDIGLEPEYAAHRPTSKTPNANRAPEVIVLSVASLYLLHVLMLTEFT